jgi:hypothetical protein
MESACGCAMAGAPQKKNNRMNRRRITPRKSIGAGIVNMKL